MTSVDLESLRLIDRRVVAPCSSLQRVLEHGRRARHSFEFAHAGVPVLRHPSSLPDPFLPREKATHARPSPIRFDLADQVNNGPAQTRWWALIAQALMRSRSGSSRIEPSWPIASSWASRSRLRSHHSSKSTSP